MEELTIGQRIAQERKKLNLSQMSLAARLDVSRQAISKWKVKSPSPFLYRTAKAVSVNKVRLRNGCETVP